MQSIREWGFGRRCAALALGVAGLAVAQAAPAAAELDGDRLKRLVVKLLVEKPRNASDTGAGLVVGASPDGRSLFILTAFHVVDEAEELRVLFHDQRFREYPGKLHRFQEELDLAVVEVALAEGQAPPVDPAGCVYLQSSRLREGDQLLALGHPLDLEWQISHDHRIMALSQDADDRRLRIKRETIDRGSSGGPLFDAEGAFAGTVTERTTDYAHAFKAEAALSVLKNWRVPVACQPVALPTTLLITSEAGARVTLDGGEPLTIGREPLKIEELKAGVYRVEISKPGFETVTREVELASGQLLPLLVPLEAVAMGRFLVLVSPMVDGADPGVGVAETTLLGGLANRRFSVVDRNQIESIRANDSQMEAVLGGDPIRLAAIGRQHGAEVVVVGGLQSEAQPSIGKFHTGRASLTLKCYRASTAKYLWADTLRVGGGDQPGKLEPSAQQARIAASQAVAEMGAQAIVDKVVPLVEPGALTRTGETAATGVEGEYSEIVVRGADVAALQQLPQLLGSRAGVTFGETLQFVAGERLVVSLRFDGDLTALAVELDGASLGGRRLRLAEAEAKRLTFDLEAR